MNKIKVLPIVILLSAILLSACSGFNFSLGAPTASPVTTVQETTGPTAVQGQPVSSVPSTTTQSQAQPQASTPITVSSDLTALENTYQQIYQAVNPSVVTITISSTVSTNRFRGFGGGSQGGQGQVVPTAEGSGFVWDMNGHIVTNNHVVEGASVITVTFADGKTAPATLVGTDPNSDLAVIQVKADASQLHPVDVADSTQVKVGQLVVAIGNPFGLGNTMTTGIVSAIGRSIQAGSSQSLSTTGNFSIADVIQTDAPINPGNSGGVLVDLNGRLIGVPSQIESASGSNSGVGFAIPSSLVKKVVPSLISNGKASHSYLGISGTTLTPDLVTTLNLKNGQQGILVATVVPGGPAESAGLQAATADANGNPVGGDIITGIDGKSVTRFEDLVSYLTNSTQPGQVVTLSVLRGGQTLQVKVTLGTQPSAAVLGHPNA